MTKRVFRLLKLYKFLIFFCITTLLSNFALLVNNLHASENVFSDFEISEQTLYFEKSEKPIKNIIITNTSKNNLYIQGKVQKITNDSFDSPKYIDTKEIIITPKSTVISPNESKTFRVVYLPTTAKSEAQYQIFFTPFDKDFNTPKSVQTLLVDVYVDPLSITDSLLITRDKEHITFKNKGNRSVYILKAKSCDKEYCENLLDIRIPQNTELKLAIDKDKIFECIQKVGSKYKKIIIKY